MKHYFFVIFVILVDPSSRFTKASPQYLNQARKFLTKKTCNYQKVGVQSKGYLQILIRQCLVEMGFVWKNQKGNFKMACQTSPWATTTISTTSSSINSFDQPLTSLLFNRRLLQLQYPILGKTAITWVRGNFQN